MGGTTNVYTFFSCLLQKLISPFRCYLNWTSFCYSLRIWLWLALIFKRKLLLPKTRVKNFSTKRWPEIPTCQVLSKMMLVSKGKGSLQKEGSYSLGQALRYKTKIWLLNMEVFLFLTPLNQCHWWIRYKMFSRYRTHHYLEREQKGASWAMFVVQSSISSWNLFRLELGRNNIPRLKRQGRDIAFVTISASLLLLIHDV